jgi:hypothetical protein
MASRTALMGRMSTTAVPYSAQAFSDAELVCVFIHHCFVMIK